MPPTAQLPGGNSHAAIKSMRTTASAPMADPCKNKIIAATWLVYARMRKPRDHVPLFTLQICKFMISRAPSQIHTCFHPDLADLAPLKSKSNLSSDSGTEDWGCQTCGRSSANMSCLIPASLYSQAGLPLGVDSAAKSCRTTDQQIAAAEYLQRVLGRTAAPASSGHGAYELQPWIASAQEDKSAAKPLGQVHANCGTCSTTCCITQRPCSPRTGYLTAILLACIGLLS